MNTPQLPWLTTIAGIRAAVREARVGGQTVALVPTMGALHDGHVRLVDAARREADCVVVSIFVNPTQFGPNEDFQRYPRTPEADRDRCLEGGATHVFAPEVEEMYPRGPIATYVEVPGVSDVLEGPCRPGHFRGVATVVMKLFQIVGPDLAFFGRKDYQQLKVIERMVADLDVPVAIRPVDTVREPDGLAMSSRNRYLDPEQREVAAAISRALRAACDLSVSGERSAVRVRQILRSSLESQRQVLVEYAEVADAETLAPIEEFGPDRRAVALVAARVGKTRLIDNMLLPG